MPYSNTSISVSSKNLPGLFRLSNSLNDMLYMNMVYVDPRLSTQPSPGLCKSENTVLIIESVSPYQCSFVVAVYVHK